MKGNYWSSSLAVLSKGGVRTLLGFEELGIEVCGLRKLM